MYRIVPCTFMTELTQELRGSSILYPAIKDWARMSNPEAIEPGWLVDSFASYGRKLPKIDATS